MAIVYEAQERASWADVTALACAGDEADVFIGTSRGYVRAGLTSAPIAAGPSRRAIEQICGVPGTPWLALRNDQGTVSLCTRDSIDTPTILPLARGARTMTAGSWWEARHATATQPALGPPTEARAVALQGMDDVARHKQRAPQDTCVSVLAIACRHEVVFYRWADQRFWDAKVVPMPRTPTTLAFAHGPMLFAGYGAYEYARIAVPPAHASSVAYRTPPTDALASGQWVDAQPWDTFAVQVPDTAVADTRTWWSRPKRLLALALSEDVLLATEQAGVLVQANGQPARSMALRWDAPPLQAMACAPYLLLLDAQGVLQVYTQRTLRHAQTISLAPHTVRLLAPGISPDAYVVADPVRHAEAHLYELQAISLEAQLEALTSAGEYREALALLDALPTCPPDLAARRTHLHTLVGVAAWAEGDYDAAIDEFLQSDLNPAWAIAPYPASIAGPLARSRDEWLGHFHVREPREAPPSVDRAALDALARFLADRRRVLRSVSAPSSPYAPVALLDLPTTCVLTALPTEQQQAMAQLVDTALVKVFLATKPALVGPLCRVDNACDVNEVRDLLQAHGLRAELVALYRSKGLHAEALDELQKACEEDAPDAVERLVAYLASLGAEHLELILTHARWVVQHAPSHALSLFTSEELLRTLPARRVAAHLAQDDVSLAQAYVARVLEAGSQDAALHTQWAQWALQAGRKGAEPTDLVEFLHRSHLYDAQALLDDMPPEPAWPSVRAALVGRLGRHDEALQLYVEVLHDVRAAEAYCAAQAAGTPRGTLFTKLLRLVAAHVPKELPHVYDMLLPHASSLALDDLLEALPPTTPVAEVRALLVRTLCATTTMRAQLRVEEALGATRDAALEREVRARQAQRILVTEGRTCARCERRLGQAVLAVR
ncbi:Vacuolar morphogenesis protein 6 [Malassezia nana]|uniref:Vacuolar morphogenesis protein 6 n=1 Tax=Malassezia nana TaxID=180528 RepID=A0AAF0EPH4_9BASI|nr:Vacuolar morphogenesis protein 6 [Malassezia nana]